MPRHQFYLFSSVLMSYFLVNLVRWFLIGLSPLVAEENLLGK